MSSSEVKQLALKNLKGKWGYALISLLLYSIISYFLGAVVFGLLLLSSCVIIGINSVFISISKGEKDDYGKVLDGFKDTSALGQRVLLSILKTVFIMLWTLLFIIPGIVKTYAYSLAELISYRNPSYSWKECLEESQEKMKGYKLKLFFFDISFILMYILSICTCGILLLYTIPYHMAARIEYIHQNIYPLYYNESSTYNNHTFDTEMNEVVTPHQTRDSSSIIDRHQTRDGVNETVVPPKVTKDRTLSDNTHLGNDTGEGFDKTK